METLKKWFEILGLDLAAVFTPSGNADRDIADLKLLQNWVHKYMACQDQAEMERRGFVHPPICPTFDHVSDWLRFRLWIEGKPLTWTYAEFGAVRPLESLFEEEIAPAIAETTENLDSRHCAVMIHAKVPQRIVYRILADALSRPLPVVAHTVTIWIDGCSGHCPSCLQRPWCEVGLDGGWPQDIDGKLAAPAEVCDDDRFTPYKGETP